MRRLARPALLAAAAALAGAPACLSAPTGRPPGDAADGDAADAMTDAAAVTWPPAGADIIAIGAGDLDGDGLDDLVVADENSGRIHLLRGGVDLDPTRATVDADSDSATITGLRRPAAAAIFTIGGSRQVLILDSPTAGVRLTVLDAALVQTGTAMLMNGAPDPGAELAITRSTFGMTMESVFLNTSTIAGFIEGNRVDDAVPQILMIQPTGTAFTDLLRVTGYVPGPAPQLPRMLAAEPERIQRADVMMGAFAWTDIRPATPGDPWTSVALSDMTGDGFPDVVGFAPKGGNPADICVADVENAALPTCYDTPFGMDEGEILIGPISGAAQKDVVILHQPPVAGSPPDLFLVRNLQVAGNTVTAAGSSPPFQVDVMPEARHAIMQLDSGAAEIVVVGSDGRVVCMNGNGNGLAPCNM